MEKCSNIAICNVAQRVRKGVAYEDNQTVCRDEGCKPSVSV